MSFVTGTLTVRAEKEKALFQVNPDYSGMAARDRLSPEKMIVQS
jgi:hypothetical protein